ncbi:MAG: hypothetical protein LBQ27_05495 [Clostridiales bacterium]|jgi:uncharacterized membrane protein YkvI|nr:hypothetical protein [Clostridiales bacterium]
MFKSFKNSALYISAIIGAGFASGSEIALFFKGQSVFVAILAGIMLGAFSGVFLYIGNIIADKKNTVAHNASIDFFDIFPRRYAVILRAAFLISSFVMLAAMTAGAEEIFEESFCFSHIGILSLLPAMACGLMNTEKKKYIFSLLIAFIIGLILYLYIKTDGGGSGDGFNVLNAVSYMSMNVFLGGYLIVKDGKADRREIALTSVFSATILAVLIFMIYNINDGNFGDMPVITAAAKIGKEHAAAVIVFLAIFSTMVSTVKSFTKFIPESRKKMLPLAIIAAAAFLVSLSGFNNLVQYAYPVISLFSSVFTALVTVFLIRNIFLHENGEQTQKTFAFERAEITDKATAGRIKRRYFI